MALSPFDFVTSISFSKQNLIAESEWPDATEKEYLPFMVNKALSYFQDTILFSNEMNKASYLTNRQQYEFLLNCPIRAKKRYSKWHKMEQDDTISLIMEVYKYNRKKAESVAKIFTPDQLIQLKDSISMGGQKNEKK